MAFSSPSPKNCGYLNQLNSDVSLLKEEIRSAFMRHKKSLSSRERWLLDQADIIKDAAVSLLMKRQVKVAEIRAHIDQCKYFLQSLKEKKNEEAVAFASKTIYKLERQLEQCQLKDSLIPKVRFVHDRNRLKNGILSYGCLETEPKEGSCNSDNSWDFIEEKVGSESDEKCDCSSCHKPKNFEIEDMDFQCLPESPDESDLVVVDLKAVCRANEICRDTSECVCDTPCYKNECSTSDRSFSATSSIKDLGQYIKKSKYDSDPLSQISCATESILSGGNPQNPEKLDSRYNCITGLNEKRQGIFDSTSREEAVIGLSRANNIVIKKASTPCERQVEFTSVIDIHSKIQGILDSSVTSFDEVNSESPKLAKEFGTHSSECVSHSTSVVEECSLAIQKILDGPSHHKQTSRGNSPQDSSAMVIDDSNIIGDLHKKLQGIINGEIEPNLESASRYVETNECNADVLFLESNDPVLNLHKKLQGILDGDLNMDCDENGFEATMSSNGKRVDAQSEPTCFIKGLNRTLRGNFDGPMNYDENRKKTDSTVCDDYDPVHHLHEQLGKILQADKNDLDDTVSVRNDESDSKTAMLSNEKKQVCFTHDLHQNLQGIFDGSVSYDKNHHEESDSATCDSCDAVYQLHERLQKILQADESDPGDTILKPVGSDAYEDPLNALSDRLQSILS